MIEIKNPYSRKRFTYREKFNKKFTDFFVPYIKKLPLKEDWNDKPKYVPEFLHMARQSIEGWEKYVWPTSKPNDVEIDLLSIYVSEYIPIENIDKLNKGLKKLLKKYPDRYGYGQIKLVDEFCNEVKQSIHGGRWSNFGYLDLSSDKKMSQFVKTIQVQGTHVSSSSVIIQFIITPSDKFLEEYKRLVETNVTDGNVYTPTIKNFFKFWGGFQLPSSTVKEQMLEDLKLEIKWRTLKEISRYFELYFTNNKLVPPSIEVYKIEQSSCKFKRGENERRNEFWDSIGMSDYLFHEISKDGYWELFTKDRDYLIDSSIKISCNLMINRKPMFHSLNFQIVYFIQDYAEVLFPILVMREYVLDLSKKIAIRQKNTFSSIKKEKPKL